MEVGQDLRVHGEGLRAGGGKGLDVPVGIRHHQVRFERQLRDSTDRLDRGWTDRQVGDEMPVHDVEVHEIGATPLERRDGVAKRCEVGRQDRGGEAHAHRLTSSAMASPGAIWKPPAGVCRITMPAGIPG